MSSWNTLSIKIDPFGPLKPPLKSILSLLEAVEAILEALLALIKAFMLDLLNPLRAIIALLLAAIRTIINQIKATGFAILFVRPDFRRADLRAVFNSVSGGYMAFERKVIGKFYDSSDIFRPQYTSGMYAAMMIFYIGVESPGDLMSEILALMNLIKHPMDDIAIAAPVNLKVTPPGASGEPVAQFWKLFQPSAANNALVLEWKLPTSAAGIGSPTLVGQIAASLPTFNLGQKFLVERTSADKPAGEVVYSTVQSKTQGKRVETTIRRYNVPSVSTKVSVRERDGSVYRFFPVRKVVSDLTYLGGLTGTYRYTDKNLTPGKAYYYRVRAYMGELDDRFLNPNINTTSSAAIELVEDGQGGPQIRFGKAVMGKPSAVVRGFVPLQTSNSQVFDIYKDLMNATLAGLLLNFELPPPVKGDDKVTIEKKTGWGTLNQIAGPIGWIKQARPKSADFVNHLAVKPTVRRLMNPIMEKLRTEPTLSSRLAKMWSDGVKETAEKILQSAGVEFSTAGLAGTAQTGSGPTSASWGLFGVMGDVSDATYAGIRDYLQKEDPNYFFLDSYLGPLPIEAASGTMFVTPQQRGDLASFLQLALSLSSQFTGYLQWYSVTIGDLFPALVPFLFDFEQWILQLLKAIESALKEITDIIETLIQRVRDLEQLLKAIIKLLDMLNITVSVSALFVSGNNGVDDLIEGIVSSENKPGGQPYGLHSGLVMTAGGPGPGFTKALDALKFLLTAGKL